ncbi:MAG: nucleotidyltransferase family protein [Bacteroidaceae bacterium]
MEAMIFAAGLGTRLKPLTDYTPKALIKVGGEPLLKRLVDKMKDAGVTDIVVNVHHLADQIEQYITAQHQFGINVRISNERDCLLETGGGLKNAVPLFHGDRPILIHNVDILSNVDLAVFYAQNCMYDATLLVSERETFRYLLFNDDNCLVGWTNIRTGEVKSPFPHLVVKSCRKYAFAGIHLFSPRLFPEMDVWKGKFSIVDFYLSICNRVKIHACVGSNLHLLDVGKQETLIAAEEFIRTN